MRSDKVVKENKKGNQKICRIKRLKPSFGFVPSLKLTVKGFDGIIVNNVVKAFHLDKISVRKESLTGSL